MTNPLSSKYQHQYSVRMRKGKHKLTYMVVKESADEASSYAVSLAPAGYFVEHVLDCGQTTLARYEHPREPQVDTDEENYLTSGVGGQVKKDE